MQTITFLYASPINTSIQPGDLAFFTTSVEVGSTGTTHSVGSLPNTLLLGEITNVVVEPGELYPRSVVVVFDELIITPPAVGDFLMFAKNRRANTASLKGYYAEIDMVNDSAGQIELFSIGLQSVASSN